MHVFHLNWLPSFLLMLVLLFWGFLKMKVFINEIVLLFIGKLSSFQIWVVCFLFLFDFVVVFIEVHVSIGVFARFDEIC
jgi:hypothetical protein